MKRFFLVFVILNLFLDSAIGDSINEDVAKKVGRVQLEIMQNLSLRKNISSYQRSNVSKITPLTNEDNTIVAYVISISPVGYILVAPDTDIRPIIAYSFAENFSFEKKAENFLLHLISYDMNNRLKKIDTIPRNYKTKNQKIWEEFLLLSKKKNIQIRSDIQQWGPYIQTSWRQSNPYNKYCPIDPETEQRSITGCGAVATAMVLNYWKYPSSIYFNENDRYITDTRQINIDYDSSNQDFPAFYRLNNLLKNLSYSGDIDEIAALLFACGIALEMDYTSSLSNSSVGEYIFNNKFGYVNVSKIWDSSIKTSSLQSNLKIGVPAILTISITTGDEREGHYVVADGYKDTGEYHLNYGWGDTNIGWYFIPDEMPKYNVIDSIIYNIYPPNFASWTIGQWETCNSNCRKTRSVVCKKSDGSIINDAYCSFEPKPSSEEACNDGNCTFSWEKGNWGNCDISCHQYQSVYCKRADGIEVDDKYCNEEKPIYTRTCTGGNCSYNWDTGNWEICGTNCKQNRLVYCKRSDGVQVGNEYCKDEKPIESRNCTGDNCTYSWITENWGVCGTDCKQNRTVYCQQSDGKIVSDQNCTEPKLSSEKSCNDGNCTFSWEKGNWGDCDISCHQYQSVYCKRVDGIEVEDKYCKEEKPIYSRPCTGGNCSYKWVTDNWETCGTNCKQNRLVYCKRSDGVQVGNEYCKDEKPIESRNCTGDNCTYSWITENWGVCGTNCIQNRTVYCQQSDGKIVSDQNCTEPKPSSEKPCNDGNCTFSWEKRNWGDCDISCHQYQSVYCKRFDGIEVEDKYCKEEKPIYSRPCTGGNCSYDWITGIWEICGTNCKHSRPVYCNRSDGVQVRNEYCSDEKPIESRSCTGYNCTYSWITENWGICGTDCKQNRTVYCQQSDGKIVSDQNCTEPKPEPYRSCTGGNCSYSWKSDDWSLCNIDCIQNRNVYCLGNDGNVVNDKLCIAEKPESSRTCTGDECLYTWFYGNWGACSETTCKQTRIVYCQKKNGVVVDDENCLPPPKSEVIRVCSQDCSAIKPPQILTEKVEPAEGEVGTEFLWSFKIKESNYTSTPVLTISLTNTDEQISYTLYGCSYITESNEEITIEYCRYIVLNEVGEYDSILKMDFNDETIYSNNLTVKVYNTQTNNHGKNSDSNNNDGSGCFIQTTKE